MRRGRIPFEPTSMSDRTRKSGFTLLELLAVIMVIGVILGLALPRVSSLGRAELRASARRLSGTIRLGYHLAVLNKKNYRLLLDLDQQTYQIEERMGDEYVPVQSELLQPRVLPEGVWIREVRIADRECENECLKEYIYFSPYGYVEEAAIYLCDDDEQTGYTLLTQPMIGKVVIKDGYVPLPREKTRH